MTSTKPYVIAKRAVWEAYQQVKANRGAAGIDDEAIAMFEQNLSRNLYKLWNRSCTIFGNGRVGHITGQSLPVLIRLFAAQFSDFSKDF
jgi:hypothetical protein